MGRHPSILTLAFGAGARSVSGAASVRARARWFDWAGGRFSAHSFGDHRLPRYHETAVDPVGTAGACADSPAGRSASLISPSDIVETAIAVHKPNADSVRLLQQPFLPTPTSPIVAAPPRPSDATTRPSQAAADLRRAQRGAEQARRQADDCAKVNALPVRHPHAAGIDVGDASHWVCVEATPDGADPVREFPAHTPGLRQLVAWLRQCAVTTVALEASGAYGQVLFLTLLESGFQVVQTAPHFARQIKGRPKTDRRDCQWIRRLHQHGLLPSLFQPDETTQTLRDYVRQRANLVRLSSQHIQRMQKAWELMNLKLTKVLGDVTGVTGLKIIRAILTGQRDPHELAKLRDRRCKHTTAETAVALYGRYRPEHLLELRCCLTLWEKYQQVIAEVDQEIAGQLRSMRRHSELPPLPP
ncbi:MAG: IS110 family transposase, partial [Dehalococcoidia bacterium]